MTRMEKQRFEKLFATDPDEARDFILRLAYGRMPDTTAQALFLNRFPPTKELLKELATNLKDLQSSSEAKRSKAAKSIEKTSRGNWTILRKYWLADPRTVEILLPLIEDDAAEVRQLIISSLGAIAKRYQFRDYRVVSQLVSQFCDATDDLKLYIVSALAPYAAKEVWEYLLQCFEMEKSNVRTSLIAYTIHSYADDSLRSDRLRKQIFARIIDELRTCRNQEEVALWCRAAAALRIEGSHSQLCLVLPKKFHSIVARWHEIVSQ